jgi:signal recognition particle GTPase
MKGMIRTQIRTDFLVEIIEKLLPALHMTHASYLIKIKKNQMKRTKIALLSMVASERETLQSLKKYRENSKICYRNPRR